MSTGNVWKPLPMSSGVAKSANARMNTSSAAARIVGMHRGRMTTKKRLKLEQPRPDAASISELSMLRSAPVM